MRTQISRLQRSNPHLEQSGNQARGKQKKWNADPRVSHQIAFHFFCLPRARDRAMEVYCTVSCMASETSSQWSTKHGPHLAFIQHLADSSSSPCAGGSRLVNSRTSKIRSASMRKSSTKWTSVNPIRTSTPKLSDCSGPERNTVTGRAVHRFKTSQRINGFVIVIPGKRIFSRQQPDPLPIMMGD